MPVGSDYPQITYFAKKLGKFMTSPNAGNEAFDNQKPKPRDFQGNSLFSLFSIWHLT